MHRQPVYAPFVIALLAFAPLFACAYTRVRGSSEPSRRPSSQRPAPAPAASPRRAASPPIRTRSGSTMQATGAAALSAPTAPDDRRGDFDGRMVTALLRANLRPIKRCYERALTHNPTLRGTVRISFIVDSTGRIRDAVADGMGDVGACVAAVIGGLRLARGPTGGFVRFRYPFTFEPGDPSARPPARRRATSGSTPATGMGIGGLATPARALGRVRLARGGATSESHGFDEARVTRALQAQREHFRRCYEQALRRDPSVRAVVQLTFAVDPSGRFLDSSGAAEPSTHGMNSVARCMAAVVRRVRLPDGPRAPVRYRYPLELSPADGAGASAQPAPTRERRIGRVRARAGGSIGGPGNIDGRIVTRAIRGRISAIKRCYERELTTNPTLRGTTRIMFTIEPSGRFAHVRHEVDVPAMAPVGACVAAVVASLSVSPGPTGGSVRFRYPFQFEHGG